MGRNLLLTSSWYSNFHSEDLFTLTSVFFGMYSSLFESSLFSGLENTLGHIFVLLCSTPGVNSFSKDSWIVSVENRV